MSISYCWGVSSVKSSPASSLQITYNSGTDQNPTKGNTILVFIIFSGTVSNISCVDNNSVSLTSAVAVNNGTQFLGSFFYTVPSTTVTSFTVSWTTPATATACAVEYSGVQTINTKLPGNTAQSPGTSTPTITVATQDGNDIVVASLFCGASGSPFITTGIQRLIAAASGDGQAIGEGTSSAPGNVTIAGTSITGWVAAAIQLSGTIVIPEDLTPGSNVVVGIS